jgi:transposase
VTLVGMESTGVYWRPVYYVLEDHIECWLLNAQHLRNVPGRKTDVKDAAWICDLVRHGLVRSSFVPPKPIRRLRDLSRYRKAKIQERTSEVQRLDKVLQDAGIKLSSVASKVLTVSGRQMLDALVEGTHDPEVLAELAKGRLRVKLAELREALEGRFDDHHALLIGEMLAQVDQLDETIARMSERIEELIAPFSQEVELLRTIPGVDRRSAEVMIAEIGADMSRFPDAGHLASWAGLCPGKQRVGRQAQVGPHPQGVKLAAGDADRVREGRGANPRHLPLRALPPPARSPRPGQGVGRRRAHDPRLRLHMLERGVPYADLGEDHFVRRQAEHAERYRRRLVRQLERMGHKVTLEPLPAAA